MPIVSDDERVAAVGLLKMSKRSDNIPFKVKAHRYKKLGHFARHENTCCFEIYLEWMNGEHTWENAKNMGRYNFVREYISKLEPVAPKSVITHRIMGNQLDVYLKWSNGEYSWNTVDTFPTINIIEEYLANYMGLEKFREHAQATRAPKALSRESTCDV